MSLDTFFSHLILDIFLKFTLIERQTQKDAFLCLLGHIVLIMLLKAPVENINTTLH